MPSPPLESIDFAVKHYDLAVTFSCGQAFRWRKKGDAWEGVVGSRWVRLGQTQLGISAESTFAGDWQWLRHYLQLDTELPDIVATFPDDKAMRAAADYCRGMRLLRQDPWETLASFICSSTKQVTQIQQIVDLLCQHFGKRLVNGEGSLDAFTFPTAARIAEATEAELRECKLGFRAPYLLGTARAVASGKINLLQLSKLDLTNARTALIELPGVGLKIADCVLLFAYGFPQAFPIDVWIARALREIYFPKRRPKPPRLRKFIETYFGPHSGYAQQYLFHYMRTTTPRSRRPRR